MQEPAKEKDTASLATRLAHPTPMMLYGALTAIVFLSIWAIGASIVATGAKSENATFRASSAKTLESTRTDYETRLADARKTGLQQTAQSVAATLTPFVALQGQVPEITGRSLQAVVRNLVQNRDYRFVAVADASGKVVAASDLTLVDRPMRAPSGMEVATAQIGADASQGSVSIGVQ